MMPDWEKKGGETRTSGAKAGAYLGIGLELDKDVLDSLVRVGELGESRAVVVAVEEFSKVRKECQRDSSDFECLPKFGGADFED